MAIIRKNSGKTEEKVSSSKNVGRANSRDVKKKTRNEVVVDGIILQLDNSGMPIAPKAKKKSGTSLADMVKGTDKD